MTQKERMERGIIYDPNAPELASEQAVYMEKLWEIPAVCSVR
ncbi:MAG: hypothetical protein SOT68_09120 [Oscillospiraceae bacterium]|nr:hypothetical protein [Oscillospiraceae bacterium]MDY2864338.1 hypothetical protein [Oscillospiraceae bacterium]